MTEEKRNVFNKKCKDFLNDLRLDGISKKQLLDIQFCFRGVENVEFGDVNVKFEFGKIINVKSRLK